MKSAKRKTAKPTRRDRRAPSPQRRPRNRAAPILRTAGLEDAPIEAWQQAMLPRLQQIAETRGFDGLSESTFVFLCLLRLKPFEKIGEFKTWVHRVTGYPRHEISGFVDRAKEGFLIVDGRANAEALEAVMSDDDEGYVSVMLMTKVLEGRFLRHAEGTYSLPSEMG